MTVVKADLSRGELLPSEALLLQLQKNTHRNWLIQQEQQGWVYGERLDKKSKTDPNIVPFERLQSSAELYPLTSAAELLTLADTLGYQLEIPQKKADEGHDDKITKIYSDVSEVKINLRALLRLWHGRDEELWCSEPGLFLALGKKVLKAAEPLIAYDIFSEGVKTLTNVDVMGQNENVICGGLYEQLALSLAESGAPLEAEILLNRCVSQYPSSESLGLLGRVYKQIGLDPITPPSNKQECFEKSLSFYLKAFEQAIADDDLDGAYYNGINVATIYLCLGDKAATKVMADRVEKICNTVLAGYSQESDGPYWLFATLGEACLLQGDDNTNRYYEKAIAMASTDIRAQHSMRKQIELIAGYLKFDEEKLYALFSIPTVLVFSGHMLDEPNRDEERFPESALPYVEEQIAYKLSQFKNAIIYLSAANGSDIICAEQALALGFEVNIILPFEEDTFIRESVGNHWRHRFDTIILKADRVLTISRHQPDSQQLAFDFANLYMTGIAGQRAFMIGASLEGISVWDGKKVDSLGGTSSVVALWKNKNISFDCINPLQHSYSQKINSSASQSLIKTVTFLRAGAAVEAFNYLPILFADVKGYSKLNEDQLVTFSTFFITKIASVFDKFSESIHIKRTQGDGLFVIYKDMTSAIGFAKLLQYTIANTDWRAKNLPCDLSIRISLDAGPCYSYLEKITGNQEFCGDYVNRAARLEPITPPGHIYASESFVALSLVNTVKDVKFRYSGQVVLPKGHGVIPAYHVE